MISFNYIARLYRLKRLFGGVGDYYYLVTSFLDLILTFFSRKISDAPKIKPDLYEESVSQKLDTFGSHVVVSLNNTL